MYTLICIDFINEMMSSDGKLSGKGYVSFADNKKSFEKIKTLQKFFRDKDWNIVHVRVGFDSDYKLQPKSSPLFGKADQFDALKIGTYGTQFHPDLKPINDELIITKHRVSAFYGTNLDLVLKNLEAKNLVICGVSTDLAVATAVREAHDRDFSVNIVEDCCVAACEVEHESSIALLKKVANITTSTDFISKNS